MNKSISSISSIMLIIIIAFITGFFVWAKSKVTEREMALMEINTSSSIGAGSNCQMKTFQGKAKIKAWQAIENNQDIFTISEEDLNKLPSQERKIFKLIDPTDEIRNGLAGTSEKNPMEIKITGFALPCGSKIALVSLDYKDKIFRPYSSN